MRVQSTELTSQAVRHYRTSDCLIESSDSTAMAAGSWSIGCAEKSSGPRRMKKSAGYNTRLLSRPALSALWTVGRRHCSSQQAAAAWFVVLANDRPKISLNAARPSCKSFKSTGIAYSFRSSIMRTRFRISNICVYIFLYSLLLFHPCSIENKQWKLSDGFLTYCSFRKLCSQNNKLGTDGVYVYIKEAYIPTSTHRFSSIYRASRDVNILVVPFSFSGQE